ncbi:N-acyl-D-amino-acid deacylase family protein [Planococcus beigongshangi]|uniref:N-acyl-D-amino-acid deacylase family protein n=1 Tax=Planococcus beigongshangi TaxID=2782536 RepID=UPI00193C40A5|nr:D-aminoacylase [Planococcus beigongshangi]
MYDIIIRNGRLFDGSGNPWTNLDIAVKDGKIVKIGKLNTESAKKEIDAEGLAVAPGFIDTHVHSDLLCTKPDVHKIKVLQGVTTELLGQDGISVAPVSEETKPLWQKQLEGLNGTIGDWKWNSISEYLKFLEEHHLLGNVTYLVPHGAVRTLAMGFEGRESTKKEMTKMRELVEEGMRQGAYGVSTGLIYPPNSYSNKQELIEICKGAAKYDGCFVVHIRNESTTLLDSLDEVIDVARQTGVRLHVSHFKSVGLKNSYKYEIALQKLDLARFEGIEVTFDQYPYTAASTVLHSILPPWVHAGGAEKMLDRLRDPESREKIKYDFENNINYENPIYSCGWENIIISATGTERNKSVEGKSVLEIANLKNKEPADAAMDLLLEEEGNATMVLHWGREIDIVKAMKSPLYIVGSDGIFGGKPHPRLYGSFPRVLGRYVRELETISLSNAIHSMTGKAAQLLRLKDRGLLRENYFADIVVFDPEKIEDKATFEDPLQEPVGINYVIVNGHLTVENGEITSEGKGEVLRY